MGTMQTLLIGLILTSVFMLSLFGMYTGITTDTGVYNASGVIEQQMNETFYLEHINSISGLTSAMQSQVNGSSGGIIEGVSSLIDLPFTMVGTVYNALKMIFSSADFGFKILSNVIGFSHVMEIPPYITTSLMAIIIIIVVFAFFNFVQKTDKL